MWVYILIAELHIFALFVLPSFVVRRQMTAGGSCIFLCICHSETPLFLSLKINPNIFGVASYTKMLTLLETCSARRLLDLILRYAPNKVKRGFAPAVCGQLPHSPREARQAPCTPKIAPFRLPSSVTLFCGRSSHKIVLLKRTSFRSPYTPNAVFARVLPLFTMSTDPHAGQQSGVVFVEFSWSFACDGRSPRCPCSQRW